MPSLLRLIVEKGIGDVTKACERANRIALSEVSLLAPIPQPEKNIVYLVKNYHEHAKEFAGGGFDASGKAAIPDLPI